MKNLAASLIKAQADMAPLHKDAKGNFGKYATLAGVQEVCLPALGRHGIAVFQSVGTEWVERNIVLVKVSCTLYHAESGENVVNEITLSPSKTDPQGIGSAITYGRRYLLTAMAGIAPEDDDGQVASNGQVAQAKPAQRQPVANTVSAYSKAMPPGQAEAQIAEGVVNRLIASWTTPKEAMSWATDNNYTENEHSARTRWAQIVKDDFGDVCSAKNLKDIMRAYATHYTMKEQVTA